MACRGTLIRHDRARACIREVSAIDGMLLSRELGQPGAILILDLQDMRHHRLLLELPFLRNLSVIPNFLDAVYAAIIFERARPSH